MPRLKTILVNLSLFLAGLFLCLLFFEFVVFRFFLLAPDMPRLDFANGVVRYAPNQQGVYRVKNEIAATYKVNADGWGSKYDRYEPTKDPGKTRIAIIGDSYVEAGQVDYDTSFAERLEDLLGGERYQVYRFGISGAPMSQYLQVLRREVARYSPDLVIVVLVHNDFRQSYTSTPGVYSSSFLKLRIEDGVVAEELEPVPYVAPWYTPLRRTATWRYLAYRQQVRFQVLRDLILSREAKDARYQANIDITRLGDDRANNEIATDYVFRELSSVSREDGADLLVLMDGDRRSIHEGLERSALYETGALALNDIAESAARRNAVHFVDLHPVFEGDYALHHERLDFESDGHWSPHAHEVVARVAAEHIRQHFGFEE